jgi:hypothetical protein
MKNVLMIFNRLFKKLIVTLMNKLEYLNTIWIILIKLNIIAYFNVYLYFFRQAESSLFFDSCFSITESFDNISIYVL